MRFYEMICSFKPYAHVCFDGDRLNRVFEMTGQIDFRSNRTSAVKVRPKPMKV
jgi:hypothetical protein